MKNNHYIFSAVFIVTVCSSPGQAPIIIAVDEAPPFMFKIGNKAAGLYPALVETVFKRMQIPVVVRPLPRGNAIKYADKGKIGIAGIYKNSDLEKKYDYSDEIFQEKLVLFVLYENKFPDSYPNYFPVILNMMFHIRRRIDSAKAKSSLLNFIRNALPGSSWLVSRAMVDSNRGSLSRQTGSTP